jgi:DNA-binding NtrC family response regulator
MQILVVDDERIVLESCKRVLESSGFNVLLVTSADKALKAIAEKKPILILIDVKIPERNGMYLMRQVKDKWPDIPIIVMSGYYTPETVVEAEKLGAARFIAKPFTPDELLKTVRQVI